MFLLHRSEDVAGHLGIRMATEWHSDRRILAQSSDQKMNVAYGPALSLSGR